MQESVWREKPSAAQVPLSDLSIIPSDINFCLEGWREGGRRRYRCRLGAGHGRYSWASGAHASPEAAIAEALSYRDIVVVEPGLWRTVKVLLPYAVLSWIVLAAAGLIIFGIMR
jgi:hypothetical protein